MSAKTITSKRDEILETASELFYKQGYQSTGIQQIIEAADTAKGTFYSHFKSKDLLGAAWLQKRAADWSKAFTAAISVVKDPRERLLACFDYLAADLKASDYRGCAFINTLAETSEPTNPLRAHILEAKQTLRDRFVEMTEDCTSEKAEQLGSIIYFLFEASIIEAQNFRDLEPLHTARAHVKELLEA